MALRDALNVSVRSDLYNYVMQDDQMMTVIGVTTPGDIPAELWYYEGSSTATDNGTTVIKPTAIPVGNPGRYLRWIQESDWTYTNNKPTFATVSTTGDYTDLINKPTIPAAQVQSDWNAVSGMGVILNRPSLSTVAISGLFSDVTGKPSTLSGYGITDAYPLTGNPSGFLTSVPAQSFGSLTGKPTTLSGYGITDAVASNRTLTINSIAQDLSSNRSWTIDKTSVGLGNVDNTSDATKNSATASLTNKTISGSSNTISNIGNSSLTNSSITINGNSVALGGSTTVTAAPNVSAPTAGTAITVGTPFQPRAGGPCFVSINGSLTGVLGLNETVTVAMSATSGGTYTTVATDVLLIGVLGLTLDRNVCNIPVPTGWYVRVTRTGTAATFTYTKWDL